MVAKKEKNRAITRSMLIGKIASEHPKTVEVMLKYGMHCIGCPMTAYESVEQGAKVHGLGDDTINEMVKEMNRVIELETVKPEKAGGARSRQSKQ